MTSHERVVAAIEFRGPDRVPHRQVCLPATFEQYKNLRSLLDKYPGDIVSDDSSLGQSSNKAYSAGQWTDEFGCVWTVPRNGFLGQVTKHPIETFETLKDYVWPTPDSIDLKYEVQKMKRRGEKYLTLGWLTLFERLIGLHGFDNVMITIASGAPELLEMRDRIVEYNLGIIRRLLELNPDAIELADDWGSQRSLLIAPAIWRELFLPAYRRMFEPIRSAGKHIFFHSDGVTIDILGDLVEAGVNVFWVDLSLNNLDALHETLGGKVCFQGLTDVQFLMREGTPEQVKQHGRDLIAALGSFNGGFIACSELAPDQPWENIVAILEAFRQYGAYPLSIRWNNAESKSIEIGSQE